MNDVVKHLISLINQHPGKKDFLKLLEPSPVTRFRKGMTLEEFGAIAANASGRLDQHDALVGLLSGNAHDRS